MSFEDMIRRLIKENDVPEETDEERAERERRQKKADEERQQKREARDRLHRERGWRLSSAYSPMDRGHTPGKDHIVLMKPLESGRLKRKAGDALCKPAEKFWGLHGADRDEIKPEWTCKRCLEMFGRYKDQLGEEN